QPDDPLQRRRPDRTHGHHRQDRRRLLRVGPTGGQRPPEGLLPQPRLDLPSKHPGSPSLEPGGADYLVSQKRPPGPLVAGSPPVWSILSGRQPSTPASDTGGAPPAPGAGTVPDAADGIQGTNTTVPESTRAPQERGLLTSSRSSLGVRHL